VLLNKNETIGVRNSCIIDFTAKLRNIGLNLRDGSFPLKVGSIFVNSIGLSLLYNMGRDGSQVHNTMSSPLFQADVYPLPPRNASFLNEH